MSKNKQGHTSAPGPAPAPKPTPADKTPPTPEGGVLSPRDGKFEADHRPSR